MIGAGSTRSYSDVKLNLIHNYNSKLFILQDFVIIFKIFILIQFWFGAGFTINQTYGYTIINFY